MTVHAHGTHEEAKKKAQRSGDLDFDAGALASRHGISVDQAKQIIEHCGADSDCIDDEARKLTATH